MKVALGLKAHSGWSALVVVGVSGKQFEVIDRRHIELVDEGDAHSAKQPYHAAERLKPTDAQKLVERGNDAARRIALQQMRSIVKALRGQAHDIIACAVLVPSPMPNWTTAEILTVHFRMHKAEGVMFPEALAKAAEECGLKLIAIPEKQLAEHAERVLATSLSELTSKVATLGKSVGPPWGKDQKSAALAALVALQGA